MVGLYGILVISLENQILVKKAEPYSTNHHSVDVFYTKLV